MKKFLALLLCMAMCMMAFAAVAEDMRVAMITDYGDITDQSFNQTTYEAAKAYCEANGVDFTYYKPAGDSTAERVAMVEKAVDEDYNVIVMPGYAFGETIAEVQGDYPDAKFIALDVSAGDLGGAEPAANVYCAVYQEELCGYMAGYAAVKLGYTHLGFLGGMAVPAVVRYGFGFVQGADAAAVEMGKADAVTVEYVYGNQFYGDADITAYMDNWYQTMNVEVVFACGGGIYTSAVEAAQNVAQYIAGGKAVSSAVSAAVVVVLVASAGQDYYQYKYQNLNGKQHCQCGVISFFIGKFICGNFSCGYRKYDVQGVVYAVVIVVVLECRNYPELNNSLGKSICKNRFQPLSGGYENFSRFVCNLGLYKKDQAVVKLALTHTPAAANPVGHVCP